MMGSHYDGFMCSRTTPSAVSPSSLPPPPPSLPPSTVAAPPTPPLNPSCIHAPTYIYSATFPLNHGCCLFDHERILASLSWKSRVICWSALLIKNDNHLQSRHTLWSAFSDMRPRMPRSLRYLQRRRGEEHRREEERTERVRCRGRLQLKVLAFSQAYT